MNYKEVIKFWFEELSPKDWWVKSDTLDLNIKNRFLSTLEAAKNEELAHWRTSAHGRLAEIIVLDQFSRNIFRNQKEAFSQDLQALTLTKEALKEKAHLELTTKELPFLIMPLMHSESKEIHENYLSFFKAEGLEGTYEFELKHKKIIDRFGRYPHRNAILNRPSTPEEIQFLTEPGSSF